MPQRASRLVSRWKTQAQPRNESAAFNAAPGLCTRRCPWRFGWWASHQDGLPEPSRTPVGHRDPRSTLCPGQSGTAACSNSQDSFLCPEGMVALAPHLLGLPQAPPHPTRYQVAVTPASVDCSPKQRADPLPEKTRQWARHRRVLPCSPFFTPGKGMATPSSSPASWSMSARLPNSVIFLRFRNS